MKTLILIASFLIIGSLAFTPRWAQLSLPLLVSGTPFEPIRFMENNFTSFEELYLDPNVPSTSAANVRKHQFRVQASTYAYTISETSRGIYNVLMDFNFFFSVGRDDFVFGKSDVFYVTRETNGWERLRAGGNYTVGIPLDNADRLTFVVGDSTGAIFYCDMSTYTCQTKIVASSNKAISYFLKDEMYPEKSYLWIFSAVGEIILFDLDTFEVVSRSSLAPAISILDSPPLFYGSRGNFRLILGQKTQLYKIDLNSSTSQIQVANLTEGQGDLCAFEIVADRFMTDLLVAVYCDGAIRQASMTGFGVSPLTWSILVASNPLTLPDPVKELKFKFLEENPSSQNLQTGKPVLVMAKASGEIVMYDFKRETFTTLRDKSQVKFTSNMLFAPNPNMNLADPNSAHRAFIAVGAASNAVFNLTNFVFINPSSSCEEKVIFNNGSSTPGNSYLFQGTPPKTKKMSWTAVARAVISFFLPDTKLDDICQLFPLYLPMNELYDCCSKPLNSAAALSSSFDIINPDCLLEVNEEYSIITSLDHYSIQTIREQGTPSYSRIINEMINNHPIIMFYADRQIVVVGYKRCENQVIIWNPTHSSFQYIRYDELFCHKIAGACTVASHVFYTRR